MPYSGRLPRANAHRVIVRSCLHAHGRLTVAGTEETTAKIRRIELLYQRAEATSCKSGTYILGWRTGWTALGIFSADYLSAVPRPVSKLQAIGPDENFSSPTRECTA